MRLLFKGEAIFGMVDLNGNSGTPSRMEDDILQRVNILGGHCQSWHSDSTVIVKVKRNAFDSSAHMCCENVGIHVTLAGEVAGLRPRVGACGQSSNIAPRWIAKGYNEQREEFLARLDGSFALALWHPDNQQLLLMTDPRGDAHVYYRIDKERLVFSSWLQLLPGQNREFDREAIKEFLRFLYISSPRTIYNGILRLEPGHYLSVRHGEVVTRVIGPVTAGTSDMFPSANDDDSLNQFQEVFERAIHRRGGGRRVGVFMSSGIDSATLVAACQKLYPGNVEAFTVGFDEAELDETVAAKTLAHQVGVPHTELRFSLQDYRRAFDCMSKAFDQPFADPAGLALILACERIKDRVEIVSEGSGSDGLFGAPIPRHLWFSAAVSAKLPRFLRKAMAISLRRAPFHGLSNQSALFDFDEVEELFITWPGWSAKELRELLGEPVSFAQTPFYRTFRKHQNLGAQEVYEAIGLLPPEDSRFEAAALANILITLPYHDAELRAFVRGLPKELRISNGVSKILLRRVFSRFYPEGQPPPRKHYFNVPLQGLLESADFEIVREYLAPDNLKRQGLVDPESAWSWIRRYINGDERLRFKVWALLVLHAWIEERKEDRGPHEFL